MSCRRSSEETAHDRPHPALRHRDSPIGPDVDLDEDDVRLADGTGLTGQPVEEIVEEVRRRGGSLSLTGEAAASPRIAFRVTPDVRDRAAQIAAREGKTVSQLAREALEARVATELHVS